MALSSTQPLGVSTNVNNNWNIYKSYQDQDLPNVLPHFTPVRKPGFYLDAPLLRGKHGTLVKFFQLYFTDDMINEICLHTNAYCGQI